MPSRDHVHRHRSVFIGYASEAPILSAIPQAGEHTGQFGNIAIVVSGDRLAIAVEFAGSITIQLPKADAEQLHHLAGEIFVRVLVYFRPRLLVAKMAEISAHQ